MADATPSRHSFTEHGTLKTKTFPPSSSAVLIAVVVSGIAVFVLDLATPQGMATGVLYVAPVLLSLWFAHSRHTIAVGMVSVVLAALGFFVSPPAESLQVAVANRALSVLVIWASVVLGLSAKRAASTARQQDARIEAIVREAVEGIITIDEQGRIESFNPAAERMFGYKAEEVIGRNVKLLMPSEIAEHHDDYLKRYLETGERKIIGIGRVVEGLRRDGSVFPAEISVSEVWMGTRHLFTGILRDISERKRMEERLLQSERLAAIGQVVTGIAHESRNALQRILAKVEMLRMELSEEHPVTADLDGIEHAADSIHNLLEEIRQYAAPIRLEYGEYDVRSIWQEAWDELAPARSGRDAAIEPTVEEGASRVVVDATRLRRVFRNLFENSLAAAQDPVRITIHVRSMELGGIAALQITVRDNGPGLTAEQHARIFDAFYTTKTSGTGLGMAIAKRVVEAHGGTIVARDTRGQGAEFVITLPGVLPEIPNSSDVAAPPTR